MKTFIQILFSVSMIVSIQTKADPAIMAQLNTGWPQSLQILKTQLDPNKSYAVMVIKTPLANLDLRTPDQLRRSLLATASDDRGEIGHVLFGWKCNSAEGFVSQSGERSFQSMQMLDQGWGFSAIFSQFTDGVIFTPQENEDKSFKPFINGKTPRLYTLVFQVDPSACQGIMDFVDQYTNLNPNTGSYPFQNFGLALSPEKLEGGGCSSVAVTALAPSGIFLNNQNYFYRQMYFPKKLFGRPMSLKAKHVRPYIAEFVPPGKEVSLFKAVGGVWNSSVADSIALKMIDIEQMILFTKTLYKFALESEVSISHITELQASKEMKRLERRVHYLTSPEQQEQYSDYSGRSFDPVDESYDTQSAYMVQSLKQWRAELGRDKKIRRLSWNHQVAVLIEDQ